MRPNRSANCGSFNVCVAPESPAGASVELRDVVGGRSRCIVRASRIWTRRDAVRSRSSCGRNSGWSKIGFAQLPAVRVRAVEADELTAEWFATAAAADQPARVPADGRVGSITV